MSMNATRAAATRRGWGASVVSLGEVQTPTLAMMVKRASARSRRSRRSRTGSSDPRYNGLWFEGDGVRLKDGERADEIVQKRSPANGPGRVGRAQGAVRARAAPPYDYYALQRDATAAGFSARRTLSAAQSLYTRARRRSRIHGRTRRWLSGDLVRS